MDTNNDTDIEVLKNGPKIIKEFKEKLLNFLTSFSEINLNVEKLVYPLEIFQEQPELLDPELEDFIYPVIKIIIKEIKNNTTQSFVFVNKLCYILYTYCKIIGYKIVSKYPFTITIYFKNLVNFFFNDFHLLEPVLHYLQNIPPNDTELWVTRYIFLLWLSLLSMTPFDLSAIDSNLSQNITIVDSLLFISKQYLSVSGKERDAASILVSRLVTRNDTYKSHLPSFILWIRNKWILETTSIFMKIGLLSSLCNIFKFKDRAFLLTIANNVFSLLELIMQNEHSNDKIRHLITKLLQRVCLCFLKPYKASWIHKTEEKILVENLSIKNSDIEKSSEFVEEVIVHSSVEKSLYFLLENISDASTIVRYSSAKGISRIISYMSKSHANEVISAVISLIRNLDGSYSIEASSDIIWHGTTIAIAEFCKRGLLLPHRLKEILPILLKALIFEQRRGTQYLGSNVRDAACYISWSIFRRYSITDVTHLFPFLAESLLTVALFDKETNIRRAASSAYQEGVGRYGESIFPHGIEIIKEMNFYALGTKKNSYLNVSFYLFKYKEYQNLIVSYLIEKMSIHYDKEIRNLTACVLGKMTEIKPSIISKNLPTLLMNFKKKDIIMQHGILGVLAKILPKIQFQEFSFDIVQELELICEEKLPKNSLHTYPDICESICLYIAEISNTKYAKEIYLSDWIDYIKYSLNIEVDSIQYQASRAISSIAKKNDIHPQLNNFILYIKSNFDKSDTLVNGLVSALGEIEYFEKYQDTLECFISVLIEITPLSDTVFRKNSIKTLGKILHSSKKYLSLSLFDFRYLYLDKLIQLFLNGLNDYSTNLTGDVGSWVRKESMISIFHILEIAFNYNDYFLTDTIFHSIIGSLLKQTVEKLDSIREIAGVQLTNIVSLCRNKKISYLSESIEFIEDVLKKIHNWKVLEDIIPNIIQLLCIKRYQDYILIGLINSIRGNESLVKQIEKHVIFYLSKLPIKEDDKGSLKLLDIGNCLLKLCISNVNNNHFMICFMEFCNILFETLIFEYLVGKFDFKLFFDCIRKSSYKSKSIQKISLSIKIYTGISKLSTDVASKSLYELLLLLQHSYPVIRTQAAEGLYMVFTEKDSYISNENLYSKIIDILIKTNWEKSIEENKEYIEILRNIILNS
ncbi:uncharacterized protein T551_00388 [Pneumocystis jirovecii RU7]|uniref:Uncharacterized protein n=1 Tax=Pneumocystis jirovecii (strain RU7) TaxID=1408657 RepID=A0A0W4ZVA7_PNEJ7|nr:uncharacterized protein T551_00388 [Pneumocystis jirovecii RU7]KTW32297.1 hypothetical protein T551_00388 [Pneumocystis jirovecii RU7]